MPFRACRPVPITKPTHRHRVVCALVDIRIACGPILSGFAGHSEMDARSGNGPDGSERPTNNLLRRLSTSDFALIAPHLAQQEVQPNDLLYNPGDNVGTVPFPCRPSPSPLLVPHPAFRA